MTDGSLDDASPIAKWDTPDTGWILAHHSTPINALGVGTKLGNGFGSLEQVRRDSPDQLADGQPKTQVCTPEVVHLVGGPAGHAFCVVYYRHGAG